MPALSAAWQSQEWITHGGGGRISNFTSVFPTSESHKVYSNRACGGFFFLDAEWRGKKVTSTYSFCVKKAVKYKILL